MITTDDLKNCIPDIIEEAEVEELEELREVLSEGLDIINSELIIRHAHSKE